MPQFTGSVSRTFPVTGERVYPTWYLNYTSPQTQDVLLGWKDIPEHPPRRRLQNEGYLRFAARISLTNWPTSLIERTAGDAAQSCTPMSIQHQSCQGWAKIVVGWTSCHRSGKISFVLVKSARFLSNWMVKVGVKVPTWGSTKVQLIKWFCDL